MRTIELESSAEFYGTVQTDGAVITGQLMSSATGEVVAEGTWNVDEEQRVLWMDHAPEAVTHYFPRLDDVDLERYLIHELASVYTLTDGDPDNDPDLFGDNDADAEFRLNNHHPKGNFDSLQFDVDDRRVRVAGWACDLDQKYRSLVVIILARGPRNSGAGPYQVVGYLNANQRREQAVGNACGNANNRNHGFQGWSDPAINVPFTVTPPPGYTAVTQVKIHAYNVHTTGGFTYNRKIGRSRTEFGT